MVDGGFAEKKQTAPRDDLSIFRKAAIDHVAMIMEVSGALSEIDGEQVLFVQKFVKK